MPSLNVLALARAILHILAVTSSTARRRSGSTRARRSLSLSLELLEVEIELAALKDVAVEAA